MLSLFLLKVGITAGGNLTTTLQPQSHNHDHIRAQGIADAGIRHKTHTAGGAKWVKQHVWSQWDARHFRSRLCIKTGLDLKT